MTVSSEEKRKKVQSVSYIAKSFLAGGVAGCCAKTAIAPLDRIKILFQASNPHYKEFSGSFVGLMKGLQKVTVSEGLRGHFRGHSATLARIFPYAALQYMSYEQIKVMFRIDENEHPITRLAAGSLAGTISVLGTYPLDLMRARLAFQVQSYKYKGLTHALTESFKNDGGVKGLYRGLVPTILGIVPYAGVSFFTYETLKQKFTKWTGRDSLPVPVRLLLGGFAGALAQTVAYPLDVLRRRMQVQGLSDTPLLPNGQSVYSRLGTGFTYILRTEGIRGLFIGLSINYIKAAPAVGISFVTYEFMKNKLQI